MSKSPHIGTIVWIALIALTCVSVAVAHLLPIAVAVAAIVVALAYAKAYMIMANYMELKPDMKPYRLIFEAWLVIAALVILTPYWLMTT